MPNKATKVLDPQESDDEGPLAGPSGASGAKTQRSAKACDRCRKSKSKCEPSPIEGEPCKSCAATGAECAYTAPSFRRGPPKGYIQALEHRLHQVESVLAAIMSSQDVRSRSIVDELGKDELASYILDTVDAGPFGRTGREKRSVDTTKDNFFSSIVTEKPKAQSHRSRRESRATREHVIENVIARDPQIQATRPTLAWQDRLSARLALSFGGGSATSPPPARSPAPLISASTSRDASEPPRNKRRLDAPAPSDSISLTPTWSSQSAAQSDEEEDEDDLYDCAEAFGNLSIDENREVRYHGNASGLQLLVDTERTDRRNIEGIWDFPMAKFWPGPPVNRQLLVEEVKNIELTIRLPPTHVQDRLIEVFFTYINPAVPVVDERSFMEQYKSMRLEPPKADGSHPLWATRSESAVGLPADHPQPISKLLLFAIFAYAASHLGHAAPDADATAADTDHGDLGWSAVSAEEYAICARRMLDTVYHESRISTVQALILLGVRGFGIGSLEEAWLHVGMAIRMALDLGLNRNPDKWMHNGRQLFTEREKEVRKRIWWACCLADKTSAVSLGRTIAIHEGDFSTPLLDVPSDDQDRTWQPCVVDTNHSALAPVSAAYMGYFRHMSSLYIITGEILAKVYRVSRAYAVPSRALRQQLYNRLLQWALDLPEHLNYSTNSARPCPAPHVLAMHVQYWATVLLLHRPFIPKGAELARGGSPSLDPDPVPWESYDICQSAASQIASFASLYHEKYDMRWAPPFLSNCLQAAGIMHVVTLRYKPLDAQASAGLQKCIHALTGMEVTWAMALRVRHLIQNAKVNVDQTHASAAAATDARPKRPAQIAFQHDDAYAHDERAQRQSQPQAQASQSQPGSTAAPFYAPTAPYFVHTPPVASQASSSTLGFDFSAPAGLPAPSFTGYVPGYDSWWPVVDGPAGGLLGAAGPGSSSAQPPFSQGTVGNDSRSGPGAQPQVASGGAALPSQEFTFGQEHFSTEFLQAMRNPMLQFPSAFAHQY